MHKVQLRRAICRIECLLVLVLVAWLLASSCWLVAQKSEAFKTFT